MPAVVAAPEAVRQRLGEEVLVEFVPWIEEIVREQSYPWIEQLVHEQAVPRDEYREVLSRLDVLEHDVAGVKEDIRLLHDEMHVGFKGLRDEIEGLRQETRSEIQGLRQETRSEFHALRLEMNERFDRIDERFDRINERFDRMSERFIGLERHMETRLDQMSERMLVQTRWLIGSIALFGTIITILLAIAQFAP